MDLRCQVWGCLTFAFFAFFAKKNNCFLTFEKLVHEESQKKQCFLQKNTKNTKKQKM